MTQSITITESPPAGATAAAIRQPVMRLFTILVVSTTSRGLQHRPRPARVHTTQQSPRCSIASSVTHTHASDTRASLAPALAAAPGFRSLTAVCCLCVSLCCFLPSLYRWLLLLPPLLRTSPWNCLKPSSSRSVSGATTRLRSPLTAFDKSQLRDGRHRGRRLPVIRRSAEISRFIALVGHFCRILY